MESKRTVQLDVETIPPPSSWEKEYWEGWCNSLGLPIGTFNNSHEYRKWIQNNPRRIHPLEIKNDHGKP